jgi:hypothetical protein
MNFLYYDKDTGAIKAISPVLDSSISDPYIKIHPDLGQDFYSGKKHTHQYAVNYRGELCEKHNPGKQNSSDNRIYCIPYCSDSQSEFLLEQNCTNKSIKLSLTPEASAWWQNNNCFGQTHYFIVACPPQDPYFYYWTFVFEISQLIKGSVIYHYQGSDNLSFFTRKIFESYCHVKHY